MFKKLSNAILLSLSLITASPLVAATQGTLTLQGVVGLELSLLVSPVTGVNDGLVLSTTANNLKVASVAEASNSKTGYKVSIASSNAGKLKNGNLDELTYTLKYGNNQVNLSTNAVVAKTQSQGGVQSASTEVFISYTGKPATQMVQGTYNDTLTFTIAAN